MLLEKNKLTSETGYLKCNDTGDVFNYSIYLGIYDSKDNYSEIDKTEYDRVKAEREHSDEKRIS